MGAAIFSASSAFENIHVRANKTTVVINLDFHHFIREAGEKKLPC